MNWSIVFEEIFQLFNTIDHSYESRIILLFFLIIFNEIIIFDTV